MKLNSVGKGWFKKVEVRAVDPFVQNRRFCLKFKISDIRSVAHHEPINSYGLRQVVLV
jgi:hypothetical protein